MYRLLETNQQAAAVQVTFLYLPSDMYDAFISYLLTYWYGMVQKLDRWLLCVTTQECGKYYIFDHSIQ